MSRARRWALLLLCAVLLSGCAAKPPENVIRSDAETEKLISADTEGLSPSAMTAALYFRYGDTAFLAAQVRAVEVQRDETPERALVQALLDGPMGAAGMLSALFPPNTQVLATASQGDTLFITFSDAFMGRYADESGEPGAPEAEEMRLRRQMCLDSLSATLTEAGLCARVQVLVYRGASQGTSMRLPAGFLDQSGNETLLPPLTRNEERLLTPHNTAQAVLDAWMSQNWAVLYDLTARTADRPREQAAFDAFAEGRTLVGRKLSPGNVSLDGRTAVAGADLTLLGESGNSEVKGYPLRLTRDEGLWKIGYADLIRMMNQD